MLGVGLGLGALLFGASEQGGSGPEAASSASDGLETGRVIEEAPTLEGRPEEGRTLLAAAIEAVPALASDRVDGEITGTVTLEDGSPLAGVTVTISPPRPSPPGGWERQQTRSTEDMLRYSIAMQKFMEEHTQKSTTDDAGAFAFADLVEGEYRISAAREDYTFTHGARAGRHGFPAGSEVHFRATRLTGLRVNVVAPSGVTPERLRVSLRRPDGGRSTSSIRDTDRVVRAKPGTYVLTVLGGEEEEWSSAPQEIVIAAGEVLGPIDVVLVPRPRIVVEIDFGGDTSRNIRIAHTRVPSGMDPDPDVLESRLRDRDYFRSGRRRGSAKENEWVLEGEELEAGTFLIAAFEGRKRVAHVVAELGEGTTRAKLVIPSQEVSGQFTLVLQGPTPEPPARPQIMVYVKRADGTRGSGANPEAKGGGTYTFPSPEGADDPEATVIVMVTVPGWGSTKATQQGRANPSMRLTFQTPAEIQVEVAGIHGTVFEGNVTCTLMQAPDPDNPFSTGLQKGKLDSRGRGTIRGIQPGDYIASVGPSDSHGRNALILERVKVGPGTTSLKLALPKLMVVKVRAKPGTRVTLNRNVAHDSEWRHFAQWHAHQLTNDDGVATFVGVPTGTYQLWASGKQKSVEITGDTDLTLED